MKSFRQFYAEKVVIGLIETINIEGIGEVSAKIDSGNGAYNVLHGEGVVQTGDKVRFVTVNDKTLNLPIEDIITINVGAGNVEERPVVSLNFTIGSNRFDNMKFSISNRSTNEHPVLLSKQFVGDHLDALIDVTKANIAP